MQVRQLLLRSAAPGTMVRPRSRTSNRASRMESLPVGRAMDTCGTPCGIVWLAGKNCDGGNVKLNATGVVAALGGLVAIRASLAVGRRAVVNTKGVGEGVGRGGEQDAGNDRSDSDRQRIRGTDRIKEWGSMPGEGGVGLITGIGRPSEENSDNGEHGNAGMLEVCCVLVVSCGAATYLANGMNCFDAGGSSSIRCICTTARCNMHNVSDWLVATITVATFSTSNANWSKLFSMVLLPMGLHDSRKRVESAPQRSITCWSCRSILAPTVAGVVPGKASRSSCSVTSLVILGSTRSVDTSDSSGASSCKAFKRVRSSLQSSTRACVSSSI
mmetsp:Transcript_42573/g.117453  ORF Transcript_42573/g.117453 Transcript_42573/m.117453 type:complete len:329 (-) Transcript_42573:942-1928(-)